MRVAVVVNMFGDNLGLVKNTLRAIRKFVIDNDAYVILSWSNPPSNYQKIINELIAETQIQLIILRLPKMGLGKQRDLTLKYVVKKFDDVKYIAYIEDDAFIDSECLRLLINALEILPKDYALISPERGARLCIDFVVNKVLPSNWLYVALTGGSGVYVIRADVIRKLIKMGLDTYSSFMFFHWEDIEFILKLWLLGYKTVSYELKCYRHIGETSHSKPLHRRYTEYNGPLIAIIANTPYSITIKALLVRFIRDILKSMLRGEIFLFLRSYLFLTLNLKHILTHRIFRRRIYNFKIYKVIIDNCIK